MFRNFLLILASFTFLFSISEGWYRVEIYRVNILSDHFNAEGTDGEPVDIEFNITQNGEKIKVSSSTNLVPGTKGDYHLTTPVTWDIYHTSSNNYQMEWCEEYSSEDGTGQFIQGGIIGLVGGLLGMPLLTTMAVAADTVDDLSCGVYPSNPERRWIFDYNNIQLGGKPFFYLKYYKI